MSPLDLGILKMALNKMDAERAHAHMEDKRRGEAAPETSSARAFLQVSLEQGVCPVCWTYH